MVDLTFGQMLMQDALPSGVTIDGPITKGKLRKAMTTYAKSNPREYVKAIQEIKRVGDQVATWEGISVGLDDIAPDYKNRDPVMQDALRKMKAAKSDEEKRGILLDTQNKFVDITKNHPSDMTIMARSGGRGSIPQLMKTVASPVVATAHGEVTPWLVTKSYAQGLNPADAWVTGVESRRNAIASTGSVVEPGAAAKVVVSNMEDLVVTQEDCGTRSGIMLDTDDQIADRFLARSESGLPRNELVTPDVVNTLNKKGVDRILVRSPSTCEAKDGVCRKCMGLNEWGKPYPVGTNVGSRSAQALTEPLTQFVLNAKHGVRLAGGDDNKLRGLSGFKTLTEVPKSFTDKAAIAEKDGKIESIVKAPQGGHYITLAGKRYYTPPKLDPIVKVGDRVEAGDALTDGTPMPDAVVRHKGIGEGRRYLSDSLTKLYRRQGVDIDRRHTELLSRKAMNYVRVEDDDSGQFIPGDVVEFNKIKGAFGKSPKRIPVGQAQGKTLAAPVLHYTEGTRVTQSVISELKRQNVKEVEVATKGPRIEPIMKSMIQTPLLSDDWMSRLSHRYLRKTLVDGAGFGMTTDVSSTSPVPAYIEGRQFATGQQGKYASEVDQFVVDTLTAPINRPTRELRRDAQQRREDEGEPGLLESIVQFFVDNPDAEVAEAPKPKAAPAPPPPAPEESALDAAALVDGVPMAAKQASLSTLKRVMFGRGAGVSGANKLRKALDDDTFKIISPSGGVDSRAVELRRAADRMGGLDLEDAGLTDRGIMTSEGDAFIRKLDESRPGLRRQYKGEAIPDFDPKEFDAIKPGLGQRITPQMYEDYMQAQRRGRSIGRFAKDMVFGEDPLEVLRQRYRTGGILGRGGVMAGDFAIDPDTLRSYKRWRAGKGSLKELAAPAAMEAAAKYYTFVAPAQALYYAATEPVGENESRYENVGGAAGDVLGWAAASPFNLGGVAFASPVIAGGKAIGRGLDPNYTPPQDAGDHAVSDRLRSAYSRGWQSSPVMEQYSDLQSARTSAQQYYDELRRRRTQQQQQQQQQAPSGVANTRPAR